MIFALLFISVWILKVISAGLWDGEKYKESTHYSKITIALLYPLLALAFVSLWNYWAADYLGWPQVTSLKEAFVLFMIF